MSTTSKPSSIVEASKDNLMLIEIRYVKFVMPYADGMLLMKAFKNAELYTTEYKKEARVMPLSSSDDGKVNISPLSWDAYADAKAYALMHPEKDGNNYEII